jgi:hypothetical protein
MQLIWFPQSYKTESNNFKPAGLYAVMTKIAIITGFAYSIPWMAYETLEDSLDALEEPLDSVNPSFASHNLKSIAWSMHSFQHFYGFQGAFILHIGVPSMIYYDGLLIETRWSLTNIRRRFISLIFALAQINTTIIPLNLDVCCISQIR